MEKRFTGLAELDQRSREIFRHLVETYIETGEPVGSRTLSRGLPLSLSPASVRNVMSDLEATGLIYAPHTSAGRMPTEIGLRMFVDGLLEIGDLALNLGEHVLEVYEFGNLSSPPRGRTCFDVSVQSL